MVRDHDLKRDVVYFENLDEEDFEEDDLLDITARAAIGLDKVEWASLDTYGWEDTTGYALTGHQDPHNAQGYWAERSYSMNILDGDYDTSVQVEFIVEPNSVQDSIGVWTQTRLSNREKGEGLREASSMNHGEAKAAIERVLDDGFPVLDYDWR